jgi:hypothetical protein
MFCAQIEFCRFTFFVSSSVLTKFQKSKSAFYRRIGLVAGGNFYLQIFNISSPVCLSVSFNISMITHQWNDVTELCQKSLSALSIQLARPMVAVPNFSLHESMSAVEVRLSVVSPFFFCLCF